jgi:signal peptide peptidase-like protein 2B
VTFAAWNASWVGLKRPRHAAPRTGREAELIGARGAQQQDEEDEEDEGPPALDLSVGHTVGFIATASCFLVLLFYVDLNKVIGALYCISAGSAVANVAARPLLRRVLLPRRLAQARLLDIPRWEISITALDFLSTAIGLGMGIWWLLVRDTASYAWVLQDMLGVALCVLFLTLVRFPNIKVATVLLVLAFVYDIFFVFLSPIFFHESVMIKVCVGMYAFIYLYIDT